jgi:hypothetical protein
MTRNATIESTTHTHERADSQPPTQRRQNKIVEFPVLYDIQYTIQLYLVTAMCRICIVDCA